MDLKDKEGMMSLLHSFYCWGSVGVILVSTVFFEICGIRHGICTPSMRKRSYS